MNSNNITVTNARARNAFDNHVNRVIDKRNIPQMIEKKVNDAKIKTGVVLKFYQYKDQALVRLADNTEVICSFLHRMAGDLIDFYTPAGEDAYCDIIHERCIIPRAELHVMVADVHDGTDEMLILGYFQPNDIVYVKPADSGCYKLSNINATNEFGINVGNGKVEIKSLDGVNFTEGVFPEDEAQIEYANSEDVPSIDDVYKKSEVYNKSEVYTKEEVDELINDLLESLGVDTDANTSG